MIICFNVNALWKVNSEEVNGKEKWETLWKKEETSGWRRAMEICKGRKVIVRIFCCKTLNTIFYRAWEGISKKRKISLTSSHLNISWYNPTDTICSNAAINCTVDVLSVSRRWKGKQNERSVPQDAANATHISDGSAVDWEPIDWWLRAARRWAV